MSDCCCYPFKRLIAGGRNNGKGRGGNRKWRWWYRKEKNGHDCPRVVVKQEAKRRERFHGQINGQIFFFSFFFFFIRLLLLLLLLRLRIGPTVLSSNSSILMKKEKKKKKWREGQNPGGGFAESYAGTSELFRYAYLHALLSFLSFSFFIISIRHLRVPLLNFNCNLDHIQRSR